MRLLMGNYNIRMLHSNIVIDRCHFALFATNVFFFILKFNKQKTSVFVLRVMWRMILFCAVWFSVAFVEFM